MIIDLQKKIQPKPIGKFVLDLTHQSFKHYSLAIFMLLAMYSSNLTAQNKVAGTVTDFDGGFPLTGVNIVVLSEEGRTGTITDLDGKYQVNANQGDVLQFSYLGYKTQEITVSTNTIDVVLEEDSGQLDEVVVIGYGAVVKKDLTGGVTKIGEKDFNQGVTNSPENLLNGKVAGLQINNNGEPGGEMRVRLRGGTSLGDFGAKTDPLIVIDGVPVDNTKGAGGRNPLNFINPNDIADMTVLKDASAAAIYGSRGANGVIIITTKSGSSKRPTVTYSGLYSIGSLGAKPKILPSSTFRDAINAKAPQLVPKLGESNTNWVDVVTQNATGIQNNLSVAGKLKNFNYFVSGSQNSNEGIIKTSKNESYRFAVNLGASLLNESLIINFRHKTGLTTDRFSPEVLGAARAFDPTQPVYDIESPYGGYYEWGKVLATGNPLATLELTNDVGNQNRYLNNIDVEYKLPFIEGLSLKTNLSNDRTVGSKSRLLDPLLYSQFLTGGLLFLEDENHYSNLIETYGIYNKTFGNQKLQLTLGHSWQDTDRENRWNEGRNLEPDDSEYGYRYTTDIQQDSFLVHSRLISFFGRANYNLNEKYLFTASLRRDGSSRFGPANKWGLFPAAAFAWRILEEDMFKNKTTSLSDLKFRVSYGVTGNEAIRDYLYSVFYRYGSNDARYQFGDKYVTTIRGIGVDPNIKWEETRSFNIGVDFGFLNNRLNGSLDLYNKQTVDLLFEIAAPAFTNLSDRILTNIGEMNNKGVELSLNAVAVDRENFDWNLGFNIAHNRNRVVKLDNSKVENIDDFGGYETGGISGDVGQTIQIIKVGESVNTFRTYRSIRDGNGLPIPDNVDTNGDGAKNLLDRYEDLNGDGMINENDLTIAGNANPIVNLGLTSNMNYKNFDLSMTLRSMLGHKIYNNVASANGYFERLSETQILNNIENSAFTTNFNTRQLKSDYYLEDASFLKMDNISLGYNIRSIKFLKNIRVAATVTNLFTLTGYSGLDPELPLFNGGIDNSIYPITRTYIIGLNASF